MFEKDRAQSNRRTVEVTDVNVFVCFCFVFGSSAADHPELDAQISAPDTPGQVEGYGDRPGRGEVPVFRVPGNRVHGRHGLSKSTGKYPRTSTRVRYVW